MNDATVVLVDERGQATGTMDKLDAHRAPGVRHRALSAFVLDGDDRLLLQRRAATKYHFAGLWSNSCCTHPVPDETVVAAAERRIREELGITCRFEEVGVFTYRAVDPVSGLVEHEVDHVLVGRSTAAPAPDPAEVQATRSVTLADLHHELATEPRRFTPWLAGALAVLTGSTTVPQEVEP